MVRMMMPRTLRKQNKRIMRLLRPWRRRLPYIMAGFISLVCFALLFWWLRPRVLISDHSKLLGVANAHRKGVSSAGRRQTRAGDHNPLARWRGADRCYSIGLNPDDPIASHINSRFLCSISPVCFRASNLTEELVFVKQQGASGVEYPPCVISTAQPGQSAMRTVAVDPSTCEVLRYYGLACAHGEGYTDGIGHPLNKCTTMKMISEDELTRLDAAGKVWWYNGISVLVPSYAWVYNIYHYGRQLSFVAHVVRHLRHYLPGDVWERASQGQAGASERSVRIVFRLLGYYPDSWHVNMTDLFFARILQKSVGSAFDVQPRPAYLFPKPNQEFVCLRSALVLGAEGATDSLQFLNDSKLRSSPPDIPDDAIAFKESTYKELGLNSDFARTDSESVYHSLAVPAGVVGYAVREANSSRRFPPDDEAWFRKLLEAESLARNLDLVEISVPVNRPLREQVRDVQNIGFMVGLHGANLVNSMFMKPGAALFEIFPFKYVKIFYMNGGNSGLRYSSHEVESSDDRDCTAIRTLSCQILYRDVTVNLTSSDRTAIAKHIRDGMDYIVKLRASHPSGYFSVRRDANGGPYVIDGFDYRESPIAIDQFPNSFGAREAAPDGAPYLPKSTLN